MRQRREIESRRRAVAARAPDWRSRPARPARRRRAGSADRRASRRFRARSCAASAAAPSFRRSLSSAIWRSNGRHVARRAFFAAPISRATAVARRPALPGLGLGRAPGPVERQDLLGARRQAAPREAAIERLRVVANPSEIVHAVLMPELDPHLLDRRVKSGDDARRTVIRMVSDTRAGGSVHPARGRQLRRRASPCRRVRLPLRPRAGARLLDQAAGEDRDLEEQDQRHRQRVWLKMSGGVSTAATTNMPTMA